MNRSIGSAPARRGACTGISIAAAALVLAAATSARADDSERGPFYFQGHVLGVSPAFADAGSGRAGATFPLELHAGYHVSGRHDGFVFGVSQRFAFGSGSYGATMGRLGWDIPVRLGKAELTIAPYAFGGVLYGFGQGSSAAAHFGAGTELRLFPLAAVEPGAPKVELRERKVVLMADHIDIKEKIQFKQNEAVIEAVSHPLLDEIARVIKENPQIERLRIEGHASSEGDAARNESLSDERAHAVMKHLVERGGVRADVLEAKGYGASKPIATNDTPEGREKNRRVEFNIVKQGKTVEKTVVDAHEKASFSGFFVVLKPIEVGFTPGDVFVTDLVFQLGVGYAL